MVERTRGYIARLLIKKADLNFLEYSTQKIQICERFLIARNFSSEKVFSTEDHESIIGTERVDT